MVWIVQRGRDPKSASFYSWRGRWVADPGNVKVRRFSSAVEAAQLVERLTLQGAKEVAAVVLVSSD